MSSYEFTAFEHEGWIATMLDNDKARGHASTFIDPIAKSLLRIGLTANAVTWLGALATTAICVYFIPRGQFLAAGIWYGILASSDLLDGTMARISGTSGRWGAFLDSTLDRVVDAAVIGAMTYFCMVDGQPTWSVVAGFIAIAAAQITSYIRAKAESIGIECKVGLAERSERSITAWLSLLVTGCGLFVIHYALLLLAVASSVTVAQRMMHVAKQLT